MELKMLKVNFEVKKYFISEILFNSDANLRQELSQIHII